MLNSAEYETYPGNKCLNANNLTFLARLLLSKQQNFIDFNIYVQFKFHAQLSV